MPTPDLFDKELLFQLTELGFRGYNLIGRGVVFRLKENVAEQPFFYIKSDYATQVKGVNNNEKSLIREYLRSYNPQTEIIVFYFNEVLVLDAFESTGKTLNDYDERPKPVKPPKQISYQKK